MKKQIFIDQITEKPEGNFDLVLSGDAHQMEADLELLLGEENGRWTCECFLDYACRLLDKVNEVEVFHWDFQFLMAPYSASSGTLFVSPRSNLDAVED